MESELWAGALGSEGPHGADLGSCGRGFAFSYVEANLRVPAETTIFLQAATGAHEVAEPKGIRAEPSHEASHPIPQPPTRPLSRRLPLEICAQDCSRLRALPLWPMLAC